MRKGAVFMNPYQDFDARLEETVLDMTTGAAYLIKLSKEAPTECYENLLVSLSAVKKAGAQALSATLSGCHPPLLNPAYQKNTGVTFRSDLKKAVKLESDVILRTLELSAYAPSQAARKILSGVVQDQYMIYKTLHLILFAL